LLRTRHSLIRSSACTLVAALVLTPAAAWSQIVINELYPNPPGSIEAEERVEIYNAGSTPIDVTGWAIEDAATINDGSAVRCRLPEDFDSAACPGGAVIQPGEYRLLKGQVAMAWLNNGGDVVYLCSNRTLPAVVLQVVSYPSSTSPVLHEGDGWAAVPNGSTTFDWRSGQARNIPLTLCASNAGPDAVAPGTVANLAAAAGDYPGEVRLTWTAPGDDGATGTASAYQIKLAHVPINSGNFTSVADVGRWINPPLPAAGGSAETFVVFGLNPDSTYYFALRALDEVPNNGGVSNSPSTAPVPGLLLNTNLGYTPYFGNLHSHTSYSDGVQTPTNAYTFARNTAPTPLDYLAVTDHNHPSAGMSYPNYAQGLSQAAAANDDGNFVAIYGQEWGLASHGHVNIFEAPGLFGWDAGSYDWFVAEGDYPNLYTTVLAHPPASYPAIGLWCHPATNDFNSLQVTDDGKSLIHLMCLVNGPAMSASTTESDIGNTGFDGAFQTALRNGYRVSPTADQDNHLATWGAATQSRTAVLTTAKTKGQILSAMAARRTYASQDHNTRVDFSANGHAMGEAFIAASGIRLAAHVTDADGGESVAEIELFRGVTGSSNAVKVANSLGNADFNWRELQTFADGTEVHYYLRIRMSTNASIWTGPIYVTYDASSPVAVDPPQGSARLAFAASPIPALGDLTVRFTLPRAVPRAELVVFDPSGRRVRTLARGPLDAGDHRYVWDGRGDDGARAPAGIFFIRLDTSVGSVARRVLMLQ
jgi:hypothetical protein